MQLVSNALAQECAMGALMVRGFRGIHGGRALNHAAVVYSMK
jgi:hypothetical protein